MCCPRGCGEPRRPRGDLAPEHPAGVRGRVVEDDVGRRRVSQDLQKKGKVSFYLFYNLSHLQAWHDEHSGARVLGGNVPG